MKRLSAFLLPSLLVAQLTACGEDGSESDSDTDAATGASTGETGTSTSTSGSTSQTSSGTTTGATTSATTEAGTTVGTTESSGVTVTSGATEGSNDTGSGEETGATGADETRGDTELGSESEAGSESEVSGETGNGGDAAFCSHTCTAPEDCTMEGADLGLSCISGQCRAAPVPCETSAECNVTGWDPCSEACTTACVIVGEEDLCALVVPSEFITCETVGMSEVQLENSEGEPVAVCMMSIYECQEVDDAMQCVVPPPPACNEEGGSCPEGTMCDETSGACISCAIDSECEDGEICHQGSCIIPCEDPEEDCSFISFDGGEISCVSI